MSQILTNCPACGNHLTVSVLKCEECGLELNHRFALSKYDLLDAEQLTFLETFLSCEGNLKELQARLNISYPFAKKKLFQLLKALHLKEDEREEFDIPTVQTGGNGVSEIIRDKLIENGGVAEYHTYDGTPHQLYFANNGTCFASDALNKVTYRFDIFDCVYDAICQNGGRARKGAVRGNQVGDRNLDDTTISGYLASHYFEKEVGNTMPDPLSFLLGIMEWAGIISNNRGFAELTAAYQGGGR